ncbi:lysylphosphatidylglycerol synthase transmembrane domain-containing protein [Intrasporangium chromatireducens]|uniref:lysylphosphatidylglycerol synthase transmembrane domain-containing protein n=1 Tax=Intrasporangium chromatireducens TaxID=1386088 RepID=UPI0012DD90EF|nr:lysylphosphatidylglycerol synthase transmembrane domain-containing protein [Intrasporangium chromatireducens]
MTEEPDTPPPQPAGPDSAPPKRPGRYARLRHSVGRHPLDLVRLAVSAGVVLACLVVARTPGVNEVEAAIFHELQRLPDWSAPLWRILPWAGYWPGIVLGAGLALYLGRVRMAVAVAWSGVVAWALVLIVHELIGPRIVTAAFLETVVRTGGGSAFEFPSLHTAVAAAIASAAGPYVTRAERRVSWVVVIGVAVADLYLGNALPIGVFAAAVLGWGVGILLHLVLGAPGRRAAEPAVQAALRQVGIAPARMVRLPGRLLGPQVYEVHTTEGEHVEVKVVRRLHRLAGIGYRVRRVLASLEVAPEPALSTPRHEVAHEAYITLLAERAGVGTLPVLLAGEIEHGPPFLVRRHFDGRLLSDLGPGSVTDAQLDALWRAVRCLGSARMVHHDLRASNILVDGSGGIRIADFTFGRVGGPRTHNVQDVAELLVTLTSVVGVERAVDSAIRSLPDETVRDSLPHLQPVALHRRFRRQLVHRTDLMRLRQAIADRLDCEVPAFRSPVRPATVAILAAGGIAVYLLLPEVASLAEVRSVIARAQWDWLGATVAFGMLAILSNTLTILGSAQPSLPVWRSIAVQVASAFTGRTTVAALGYYTINISFLEKLGMARTDAVGVLLLNRAATVVVTGLATLVGILVIGDAVPLGQVSIPLWTWILGASLLVLLVAFLASPWGRTRVWQPARAILGRLVDTVVPTLRRPVRALQLVVGEVLFLAFSAAGLATTLSAIGAHYSLGAVVAVFIVASTLGQLLPTPGGLGAVEGALVAGLTAVGIHPTDAVAAALTARVLTFWLPVVPGIVAHRLLQHHNVI